MTRRAVAPTPPRAPRRLGSLTAVRLEMGRVYNDMRSGAIQTQDGARLVYTLASIGKVIEAEQVEARIADLEQRAAVAP